MVADALSRRYALLSTLETKVFGLEHIKSLYESDIDFSSKFLACEHAAINGYFRHNGYLFKEKKLCVPKCSIRTLLLKEAHEGGLMGQLSFNYLHGPTNHNLYSPFYSYFSDKLAHIK